MRQTHEELWHNYHTKIPPSVNCPTSDTLNWISFMIAGAVHSSANDHHPKGVG